MQTGTPNKFDAESAARYADQVPRQLPGLHDMHRMAAILLAEHVPPAGRVLVLGAGGGIELRAFAEAQAGWQFDGIDPSAEMIGLARLTLGDHAPRVRFQEGYIDDAPKGPFDGATCLLTLHFLPRAERLRTVQEVARRLRPGAPFVVAHHSFPQDAGQQDLWLGRCAAMMTSGGIPAEQADKIPAMIKKQVPVLSPQEDEAVLAEGGFTEIQMFYAGFTFKGWVCTRA